MPAAAELRHDAASLYRFVDSICAYCSLEAGYPAYPDPSKEFLLYVGELGNATKAYLETFPTRIPTDPNDYNIYRQELLNLRDNWFEIHRRVKPTSDADALHLPIPLIRAFTRRVSSVKGLEKTRLAVFHTEQLNYLQVVATGIQEIAAGIASIVGCRTFPEHLGLIGIPYSQHESLFLNCVISHEMGHFVFGERVLRTVLARPITDALNSNFSKVTTKVSGKEARWVLAAVADWVEELYCDLFAVRLIGPCYSYAFIELFDLTNLLDSSDSLNATAAAPSLEFSDSHPANLFRLQQQVAMLDRLGWWKHINASGLHYSKLLGQAAALKQTSFQYPTLPSVQKETVQAVYDLLPKIVAEVDTSLQGLDPGIAEYAGMRSTVQKYFEHGVVPSSVPDPKSGDRFCPNPVTIINVAYHFYLQSLESLISTIEKKNPEAIAHRNHWMRKLEQWTLKALEDYELLEQAKAI